MRLQNKYKSYNQLSTSFEQFPLRILKFKNTKWKKLQKTLTLSKQKRFNENSSIKVQYKNWEKINNYYKDGNKLKNIIFNRFDKSLSTTYFKSVLKKAKFSSTIKKMYLNMLIKPEFRLDILLWRSKFFVSSFQSRQAINEKKVKYWSTIVESPKIKN